jgi:hypothetical protein
LEKHGAKTIENVGYVLIRDYPKVHTHKGLEQAADNYIKWKGGTVIDTPTIGTPRFEKQMVGSKMVSTQVGWMRAKGGQGKQDACWVYKGVVLFIDYKVGADFQKPEQAKVQQRIERSGGTYLLIHNMQEVYDTINLIDKNGKI